MNTFNRLRILNKKEHIKRFCKSKMILNLAENLKTLMVANTKPVHVLENIKLQIHDRF